MYSLFPAMLMASFPAYAQDRGDHPWRADLALTSNLFLGDFAQIQLLGRAFVSYSGARSGNDLLASGYQVWVQSEEGGAFQRVGDDTIVSDIPFYYVSPKVYIHGVARFANSYSHLLDARLNAGGGVGITPIRTETVLFRASLGAQFEYAHFASESFNLDVDHDGPVRMVPRLALLSNGWYRVKDTPVSLRYIGEVTVNPLDFRDNHQFLDSGLDFKLGPGGWSARLSVLWTRDAVVPESVQVSELRGGLGFAYTTPKSDAAR
jgi:hypothetical protein